MDCTIKSNLTAFDDNELSDAERSDVQSHLQGCSDCQTLHNQLAVTWKALDSLPVEEPDDFSSVRFLNRLKSKQRAIPVYRWAFAASLMILLSAGTLFMSRHPRTVQETAITSSFFPMVDDKPSSDNNLFEAVFVDYPTKGESK